MARTPTTWKTDPAVANRLLAGAVLAPPKGPLARIYAPDLAQACVVSTSYLVGTDPEAVGGTIPTLGGGLSSETQDKLQSAPTDPLMSFQLLVVRAQVQALNGIRRSLGVARGARWESYAALQQGSDPNAVPAAVIYGLVGVVAVTAAAIAWYKTRDAEVSAEHTRALGTVTSLQGLAAMQLAAGQKIDPRIIEAMKALGDSSSTSWLTLVGVGAIGGLVTTGAYHVVTRNKRAA